MNTKQSKVLSRLIEHCDNTGKHIDVYNGCSESGYDDKVVIAANWNPKDMKKIHTKTLGNSCRVYCLEVPEHIFYVRRKGKAVWTGNSSRAGNKTIISISAPEMDLPYTESGLRPDVILNPHSIPTRLTLAQLFETTISKLAAKQGHLVDGTVYTRFEITELVKELEAEGLVIRDKMINGITGELFDIALFYGPQTVLRLPKFVREERHAVGKTGPKNPVTGQAITGKRMGGGHKVGEMELWVLLAQGASNVLNEEFFQDSDTFPIYVCRNCHQVAVYNQTKNKYKCTGEDCTASDIALIDSSKTALLFLQQLKMANIGVDIMVEPRMFESQG